MNVKAIQEALAAAGFDPGPIDGIRGRKTIEAIKGFQAANGLKADGIAGSRTLAMLLPNAAPMRPEEMMDVPSHMPWLQEAVNLLGVLEQRGPGDNPVILDWAAGLGISNYTSDDIPWCGLFVAHCIGSQMPSEAMPNNVLRARNWERFGRADRPCFGAVMVFWRTSLASGKGHVGFCWAEDDSCYHILGGNQSDSVSIARLSKDRLLEARWPTGADNPHPLVRRASADGRLMSQNEA